MGLAENTARYTSTTFSKQVKEEMKKMSTFELADFIDYFFRRRFIFGEVEMSHYNEYLAQKVTQTQF